MDGAAGGSEVRRRWGGTLRAPVPLTRALPAREGEPKEYVVPADCVERRAAGGRVARGLRRSRSLGRLDLEGIKAQEGIVSSVTISRLSETDAGQYGLRTNSLVGWVDLDLVPDGGSSGSSGGSHVL